MIDATGPSSTPPHVEVLLLRRILIEIRARWPDAVTASLGPVLRELLDAGVRPDEAGFAIGAALPGIGYSEDEALAALDFFVHAADMPSAAPLVN